MIVYDADWVKWACNQVTYGADRRHDYCVYEDQKPYGREIVLIRPDGICIYICSSKRKKLRCGCLATAQEFKCMSHTFPPEQQDSIMEMVEEAERIVSGE